MAAAAAADLISAKGKGGSARLIPAKSKRWIATTIAASFSGSNDVCREQVPLPRAFSAQPHDPEVA